VSPVEAADPLARLIRSRLGWDWPQLAVVAFLIYGPIEKLVIPAIGGYLALQDGVTHWVPDVEALLTGFVEFPFFWAFYLWTGQGITELFVSLDRNHSWRDPVRYAAFVDRAWRAFDHRWWAAISLAFGAAAAALIHFVAWGPGTRAPPWFGQDNTPHRVLALLLIGLVAYAVAQIVIREVLVIDLLDRLWHELGDCLEIHPYHPDDAGGLGAVGQHAVNVSYFVMMVMLFIVMGTLLPDLRAGTVAGVSFWSPLILLMWVLYLTLVPLSFVLLLWPPHRLMLAERERQMRPISVRLDAQLAAAQQSAQGDPGQLPTLLKTIEDLQATRDLVLRDFPSWPINSQVRYQLRLSSLVPAAYTVLTVVLEQVKPGGLLGPR
jgi:hypothetical protein